MKQNELITNAKALIENQLVYLEAGTGKICGVSGSTAKGIIIQVNYCNSDLQKSFAAWTVFENGRVKLFDSELQDKFIKLCEQYQIVADQEEALAKLEAQYQKQKENGIKSFNNAIHTVKETSYNYNNDFYYALGWIAKHVGTITAKLPDYLEDCFVKYFGDDTPRTVFDSKKRSPAGWQYQWSWCFIASLKKTNNVPSILAQYMNGSQKALVKTSFIWNLIDDYGFQFGKTQDINKILKYIPNTYINDFNAGYTA